MYVLLIAAHKKSLASGKKEFKIDTFYELELQLQVRTVALFSTLYIYHPTLLKHCTSLDVCTHSTSV